MRDIALTLTILSLLPVAIYRPWIGILMWSWIGYMNPHRLTWGFAYAFPFAQLTALAILAGTALVIVRERRPALFLRTNETRLLLLLWVIFTLTTIGSLLPGDAWTAWQKITKILLMTILTMYLIDTPQKLRLLLLVIAFSIGFYGIKGGIFSILTGGQSRIWGPANSFIEDNNALALALNMVIPMFYYLAEVESKKWLKNLLLGCAALSAISVIFTYSRGGFLGLAVVVGSIYLASSLKRKLAIGVLIVLAAPFIISQIPDAWFDRISTLQTYQEDGSAMSRLEAWEAAWNLAVDRPFSGGGFQVLNDYDTYIRYNPGVLENEIVHVSGVHSIYFEVLVEHGFPGLLVFLSLCFVTIRSTGKLIRNKDQESSLITKPYGRMFRASLLAYLVSGTFLELASFDLFYQLIALTVITKIVYLKHGNPQHQTLFETTS